MPELYFPSSKLITTISSLVQGFWLEINEQDEIVLHLKFEASILTKLITGCKFELVIRNPKILSRSVTLYIYDNYKDPLYVTWSEFGIEDKTFLGFDDTTLKLVESTKVRVVYYNHKNIPFFTKLLEKENMIENFKSWIYIVFNDLNPVSKVSDGYFIPENSLKGFLITIKNMDCSNDPKINFFTPLETFEWGEDLSENDYYNFDEYLVDGKHGYNQEISIKSFLYPFFEVNQELFYSPKMSNGNEFIDFLICHYNAVVLLESKNIISEKQTKLNKALIKAVNQLNSASKTILEGNVALENKDLENHLKQCDIVLRICLYNDSLNLLEGKTKNLVNSYDKHELPIFMSVRVFFQLVGHLKLSYGEKYKYNLIQNLVYLYEQFLENDEEIFLMKEFSVLNKKDESN